ncbi:hypothetical protein [Spirosoma arcticum]
MTNSERNRLIAGAMVVLLLGYSTERSLLECVAVGLSFYAVSVLVSQLGHRLLIIEIINAVACVEVLLVPVLFYTISPESMPLESDAYFSYALPATAAMLIGLSYFNRRTQKEHLVYFDNVRIYLTGRSSVGLWMILIGTVSVGVLNVVPLAIKNMANLFVSLLYTGVLYTLFSDSKRKLLAVAIALFALGYQAVQTGTFGELVSWLALFFVFWLAGRTSKIPSFWKFIAIGGGLTTMILVQSVKLEYRANTWGARTNERKGDAQLMLTLFTDRIQRPEILLDPVFLFASTARFNQGYFIGHTMAFVPGSEPYANGDVLKYLLAPLIPRIIWPDKPVTGGRDNIRRFTPIQLTENTSVNLSPMGEAYANFGRLGGVFYMLLYGLLFGGIFHQILSVALTKPTLILWIPKLFMGCLTKETDLYAEWGSLLHGLIFVFVFYKITGWLTVKA